MNSLVLRPTSLFDALDNFFPELGQRAQRFVRNNLDANIHREGDTYELTFLVPGVSKENITVEVDSRAIHVNVNQETQKKENAKAMLLEFYSSHKASRTFKTDSDLDADSAKVSLKDGVLTVRVDLKQKSEKRALTIE